MKTRILSVIAILFLAVTALEAQVEFGIVAGPNFQNMVGKDNGGDKVTNGLLVGFHAGVSASIPIATDFYFQTGLLFSQKGSRNNEGLLPTKASDEEYHTTTRISYIDLPFTCFSNLNLATAIFWLDSAPMSHSGWPATRRLTIHRYCMSRR